MKTKQILRILVLSLATVAACRSSGHPCNGPGEPPPPTDAK